MENKKGNKLKIVHVNAFCKDCNWVTQDLSKGRIAALQHAKTKKHNISIEVGYAGIINGK